MNREERRAAKALAGGELDRDKLNQLLASIAQTLGHAMPGCDVTLVVDKPWPSDPLRSDVRYASTADWVKVRALFKSMIDQRGG